MPVKIALLLCLLLTACSAPMQGDRAADIAEISGVLSGETVLHGTVTMVSDVRIPAGSRLVILPGTTLFVQSTDSTKIDPEFLSPKLELLVEGDLVVGGDGVEPVEFLPLPPAESGGEEGETWAGIELLKGADGDFSNVRLTGAETALLISGAKVSLDNIVISDNRYGVVLQDGGRVIGSDVRVEQGETGIFCWGEGSLDIRRAEIVGHDEEGVILDSGCQAVMEEVGIRRNDHGLVAPAISTAGITFADNRVDHLRRSGVAP